jgi:hypothetical protein
LNKSGRSYKIKQAFLCARPRHGLHEASQEFGDLRLPNSWLAAADV